MNPFDYARRCVTIDCLSDKVFVVSLTCNNSLRLALTMTPSAQRADHVALLARQIIAEQIADALKDEDCRMAAEIDSAYLGGEIWLPSQAATLCRNFAELHVIDCIRRNGEENRQQSTGDSESAAPSGCDG